MDVLSSMKEIPVITGYKQDGVIVMDLILWRNWCYTPVIEMLPADCDISSCRTYDELPRRPNPTSVFWNSF